MKTMEIMTISQVTKMFGISTRTLRYYEKIEILPSVKKDDYSYRAYTEESVLRLQQIIILRKLRIPLKQIKLIFDEPATFNLLKIFTQNMNEIDDEITALTTIRAILDKFISELRNNLNIPLKSVMFSDEIILNALNSLTLSKVNFKEEKSMNDLNKANEALSTLKKVRVIQIPPLTVASAHFIGENPEETAGDMVSKFAKDVNLYEIKPDSRAFGFNNPSPSDDGKPYGYEFFATIPDDLDVPAPLVKKKFKGGIYAVHTIEFPNFHEWDYLNDWVHNNNKYAPDYAENEEGVINRKYCLEEHINWIYANHLGWPENFIDGMIDLCIPVKLK